MPNFIMNMCMFYCLLITYTHKLFQTVILIIYCTYALCCS